MDTEEDRDEDMIERNNIFISHRSTDKDVADMLKDFLVMSGIPNDMIFCSSLPGNDIKYRISYEVKKRLQESIVNILILSKDYYESSYCLNEAGIAWYLEDEVDNIAVCLPEIDEDSMWGFFNGENKVRRLNNENDVASIYDVIRKRLNVPSADYSVVTRERQKLTQRYERYIKSRGGVENQESVKTIEPRNGNIDPFDFSPIQLHASVMLFFAAESDKGEIIVSTTLSGTSYAAGQNPLNSSTDARELAKWDAAVKELVQAGYIERISGIKTDWIYKVTDKGYAISDRFGNDNKLDASMTPSEVIAAFE